MSLITLMVSCEEEAPVKDPITELMAFDISNNYYTALPGETLEVHYYLTDRSGNLITDAIGTNGQFIRMSAYFDPKNAYDLTIVMKITNGNNTDYHVETFLDIKSTIFKFSRPDSSTFVADFVVKGLDQNLTDVPPLFFNLQYSSAEQLASIHVPLEEDPDIVYGSFRKENDLITRYIYKAQVYANSKDTFDFDSLPLIDSVLTMLLPQNPVFKLTIYGLLDATPDRVYFIDEVNNPLGGTQAVLLFPDSLFDHYKYFTEFHLDGKDYVVEKIVDTLPLEIVTPDLDFSVLKSSAVDFELSVPDSFDIFRVLFTTADAGLGYTLDWNVIGKETHNPRFSIPFLPQMFAQEHAITPQSLEYQYTTITRYGGLDYYLNQFEYHANPFSIPENEITSLESVRHP